MEILIWAGAAVSMLGVAGLFWCIFLVARARRQGLPDEALRTRLKQVVPLNLGALMLSAIGLMMVVVGILLS